MPEPESRTQASRDALARAGLVDLGITPARKGDPVINAALDEFERSLGRQPFLPGLMTIKKAAEYLGVHPTTIRRWIGDGRIAAVQIGPRTIRVRCEDLRQLARSWPVVEDV